MVKPLDMSSIVMASMVGLTPLMAQAETAQETKVIGTFGATILDVQVPAVTNFIYNPNTESLTTGVINVQSNTNAPVSLKMKEISVANESAWKPSLVSPTTYTESQWRNLTKAQSSKEVALGINALGGEYWLSDVKNQTIWSDEIPDKSKIGIVKNHGSVALQPTLKTGNAVPTENNLSANYVFELSLGEREDDSAKFSIDINKDMNVQSNGVVEFQYGTWFNVGSDADYLADEGAFHVVNRSLSYYQYNLPRIDTATFELTAKTLSTSGYMNSMMAIETGDTALKLYFYPDRVLIGNIVHYLDGTQYHTYRVVKEGMLTTLYIDGQYIVETQSVRNGGAYRFYFGDGTSGGSSDAYFKDIRIAPGEALYLD